jgi:hypothetical protein
MKNNKNILSAILVFTLIVTGIYSCSDEFLDETQNYNIDSENFFNSEEDYYLALIGAYDLLQPTYLNVLLGEIASDNTLCGGESATDVVGFQQIDDMGHTEVNSNLRDIWNWMFAGISRVNYFLENQNKTMFEGREAMIAEVRFLRAYYHFELVKWFGGLPIKNYEDALTGAGARFFAGDEQNIPRYSVAQVYALIESDLIYAVNNLEYTAPQVGRVTKGAAEALLGKAYLYQDKFSESATVLDNVINNGPYDLALDYSSIFEADGENSVESVFEVQYTDAEGAGFDCLQCSEGNVAVGFNGIRNHTGPTFDSGYSFNVPTQEAVDAFEAGDSRKETSILDIEAWATATEATFGIGYEHTGYYNRKYLARKGDQNMGDQNLTNPNNYRSIRFADVLLMAAEANNRGSIDDAKAQLYLNRVRERAFGNTSNNVSASGTALTDAIYHERRVELVGEGHRFFDLVRTGQAASEIDGFIAGRHELFPIPIEEIQFSNGNWSQNTTY